MKKKETVKKTKSELPLKTKSASDQVEVDNNDFKRLSDFGGLPSRDLKKNLGCG